MALGSCRTGTQTSLMLHLGTSLRCVLGEQNSVHKPHAAMIILTVVRCPVSEFVYILHIGLIQLKRGTDSGMSLAHVLLCQHRNYALVCKTRPTLKTLIQESLASVPCTSTSISLGSPTLQATMQSVQFAISAGSSRILISSLLIP